MKMEFCVSFNACGHMEPETEPPALRLEDDPLDQPQLQREFSWNAKLSNFVLIFILTLMYVHKLWAVSEKN